MNIDQSRIFHVFIKRKPFCLLPAIEFNLLETELKEKIVNNFRGYPVGSFICGDFTINRDYDLDLIKIFKTTSKINLSSSKLEDWNEVQTNEKEDGMSTAILFLH